MDNADRVCAQRGILYAAGKDAMAAQTLSEKDAGLFAEPICFHCQQAAEKTLMSVFEKNGVPAPRERPVALLLEEAAERGWLEADAAAASAAARLDECGKDALCQKGPALGAEDATRAMDDFEAVSRVVAQAGYEAVQMSGLERPGQRMEAHR